MEIGDIVNMHPSCPEEHWKGKVTEIFESDFSKGLHLVKVTNMETGFETVAHEGLLDYKNGEYHTKRPPPEKEKKICEIKKQIREANFKCSEHGCKACSNNIECNKMFKQLEKVYSSFDM